MKLTKKQEPVAYLRKNQLRSIKRFGPMHGEISDRPRPDLVAVYVIDEKALERHRAEFELWAAANGLNLQLSPYGGYEKGYTLDAWAAWKAARGIE